jgi:hypothetical protein
MATTSRSVEGLCLHNVQRTITVSAEEFNSALPHVLLKSFRMPHFGLHGQLPALHFVRALPSCCKWRQTVLHPKRFGNFGAVVFSLSDAIDCRREIDGCSDYVEIGLQMLSRYVIGKIPNRTDDRYGSSPFSTDQV